MTISEVMGILQKKSGLLGLSGVSPDMRDVLAAAHSGNRQAETAVETYCYRVVKYVGAYAFAMGGLDALAFTAGIGENSAEVRRRIAEGLTFIGVAIDGEKNLAVSGEADISEQKASVRTFVIPANEELVIARDTEEIMQSSGRQAQ